MNKVIKGVKIHSQPRQKLYDHPRHKSYNRLTVMLNENKVADLKDDGIERENTQMKDAWCGLTIFYHDKPIKETTEVVVFRHSSRIGQDEPHE